MTHDLVKLRDLALRLKVQASRRAKGSEGATLEYQASTAITSLLDALEAANAIAELKGEIKKLKSRGQKSPSELMRMQSFDCLQKQHLTF